MPDYGASEAPQACVRARQANPVLVPPGGKRRVLSTAALVRGTTPR